MKDLLNFTSKNTSAQVQGGSEGRKEYYFFHPDLIFTPYHWPDSTTRLPAKSWFHFTEEVKD